MVRWTLLCCAVIGLVGCTKSKPKEEPAAKQSIFGQTTNDIKKFDPNAGQEIVSSEFKNDSGPLLYALDGYKSAMQKFSEDVLVQQALRLFEAEHGRYPKDYQEFMEKIVKANNLRLPVLPLSLEYRYDEKNHKLVVVTKKKAEPETSKKQK